MSSQIGSRQNGRRRNGNSKWTKWDDTTPDKPQPKHRLGSVVVFVQCCAQRVILHQGHNTCISKRKCTTLTMIKYKFEGELENFIAVSQNCLSYWLAYGQKIQQSTLYIYTLIQSYKRTPYIFYASSKSKDQLCIFSISLNKPRLCRCSESYFISKRLRIEKV